MNHRRTATDPVAVATRAPEQDRGLFRDAYNSYGAIPSSARPPKDEDLEISISVDAVAQTDVEEPVVTRKELWSYYLYYNGDNGVGPITYSTALFQSLAHRAGVDSTTGGGCANSDTCLLQWGSGTASVSSIVLTANGLSFMIMSLVFTTIGSAADYGDFGRWLLLSLTVICWAAQYSFIAITSPSQWHSAMVLYMISFITYGATLVFYAAVFPRLARNTPRSREVREKFERDEIDLEEVEAEESLEKNRISNISAMHSNIGFLATMGLSLMILIPLASNALVDQLTIVSTNTYWVVLGIWWFIFQQPRPNPPLPRKKGTNYLTIGWQQILIALRQWKRLPYTFIYLFAFFLLADGVNTNVALVQIVQNDKFSFSFLKITYLGLAQAIASVISTGGFWYIQKYWKISTKPMFVLTNIFSALIPLWGMLGLWTQKFGFHNEWEFWAYSIIFGLFQAPYYAFSQTMMAELSPPGYENMFFGLFGLSNRASSMIGPHVIQGIINRTGNNWMGFPFLFALCTAAGLVIWFGVDVKQGRRDASQWAQEVMVASRRRSIGPKCDGELGECDSAELFF